MKEKLRKHKFNRYTDGIGHHKALYFCERCGYSFKLYSQRTSKKIADYVAENYQEKDCILK